jgi:hypothetical protein
MTRYCNSSSGNGAAARPVATFFVLVWELVRQAIDCHVVHESVKSGKIDTKQSTYYKKIYILYIDKIVTSKIAVTSKITFMDSPEGYYKTDTQTY